MSILRWRGDVVVSGALPSIVIVGVVSLAAIVLAASFASFHNSSGGEDRVPQEEYARLYFNFEDIPEEGMGSLVRRSAMIRLRIGTLSRYLELGYREIQAPHYRKAAEGFRKHLEKYPEGETADLARFHLAECHRGLGKKAEAVAHWAMVTESSDRRLAARARIRLAEHHFAQREYEKALPYFRAIATLDPDPAERHRCWLRAARCLFYLGEEDEAKRVLALLTQEVPSGTIRTTAMAYLDYSPDAGKQRGANEAIENYHKAYADYRGTPDKVRREALAESIRANLEGWDGIQHSKILSTLKAMLHEPGNPFVDDAVRELVQTGSKMALAPLVRELRGRDGPLRLSILNSLVAERVFLDDRVVEVIFRDPAVECTLPGGGAGLRAVAAKYIALRDSRKAVEKLYSEIRELSRSLTKGARQERLGQMQLNSSIRRALSRMESTEAVRTLAKIAGHETLPLTHRRVAIGALGDTGHPEAADALLPLLNDSSIEIVSLAIDALGRSGDSRAVNALIPLLEDRSSDIVSLVADVLGRSRDRRAAQFLRQRLRRKPPNSQTILSLLLAVYRLGVTEKDEGLFLTYAKYKDDDIRVLAHALLRQTGGEAAKAQLRDAVNDEVWGVRWHAIRWVGQGEPSAESVSALIARLPREDRRLKYQISKYLHRMTGVNLGLDPEAWRKWWEGARNGYDPASVRIASLALGPEPGRTVTAPRYFTLKIVSKKVIFVIDISGSMGAEISIPPEGGGTTSPRRDKKINIAKEELIKVLKTFNKKTAFNIIWFGDSFSTLWDQVQQATDDNTARAIDVVQGLPVEGLTNIFDSLAHALRDPKADTIYLLSDGEANVGLFKMHENILRKISAMNSRRKVRIHSIFLGGESSFMEELAKQNGGRYVPVGT